MKVKLHLPHGVRELNMGESFVIGREPGCDWLVKDPRVSRYHCKLSVCSQGLVVEDLKSKHGTFVDDQRVDRRLLEKTGVVRVAAVIVRISVESTPIATTTKTDGLNLGAEVSWAYVRKILDRSKEVLFYRLAALLMFLLGSLFLGLVAHSIFKIRSGLFYSVLIWGIIGFAYTSLRPWLGLWSVSLLAWHTRLVHRGLRQPGRTMEKAALEVKSAFGHEAILSLVSEEALQVIEVIHKAQGPEYAEQGSWFLKLHPKLKEYLLKLAHHYARDLIISYRLQHFEENVWPVVRDGILKYAQNSTTLLGICLDLARRDAVFTGLSFFASWAFMAAFGFSWIHAVVAAAVIRSGLITPFLRIYGLLHFHALRQHQEPSQEWLGFLLKNSKAFENIQSRANSKTKMSA
ncbi:MAG: FHA domain-containing protein [Oligoflexia bacterium]|nr:FHA domain-containing protein [Oligoflexia bacterium]